MAYLARIRKSLSMKLSLSFILLAVPIFVIALGILFMEARNNVKREATERANTVLDVTLQRIDRFLNTVETATYANDWLILEHLNPDSLLELTHRIVLLNGNIDGCSISAEPYVFPEIGRYFSVYTIREGDSIISTVEQEYEYFEKIWYKKPKVAEEACWVDYFDEVDSLEVVLDGRIASYSVPIYNDKKELVAVISTDLALRHLSAVITAEKPYPNSYFFMIGENGDYYMHPDTSRLFTQTIFDGIDATKQPDMIALGHEMTKGNEGNMRVFINGKPCLVCYHPVPDTKWSLALVCPESDILQSLNTMSYIIILLIVAGMLCILLLCRRTVSRTIRPLNQLVNKSQRIAAGHYDEHIPHSDRLDVVGQLQNSFATMQESLEKHITEVRQLNTETAQRNEELLHARQMAEEAGRQKTAFIQNMTHQIRTPLNIIMGFAQVLFDNMRQIPEEEVSGITSTMNHHALLLNRMVLMLYDSSEAGMTLSLCVDQNEVVPCNDVARESIDYTIMHFPGLSIRFEPATPDTLTVHSNRLYLMRCIRELLYNSAKYSDGQNIVLKTEETDDSVLFILEDTGPGIAEEYHELMFVPFTKVNDLSEGLGLGLPLAKRHAYNLGGSLAIDSSYHNGCRFIITIPKR